MPLETGYDDRAVAVNIVSANTTSRPTAAMILISPVRCAPVLKESNSPALVPKSTVEGNDVHLFDQWSTSHSLTPRVMKNVH